MVSGSVSWAKLEPDGERKVSEFIDSLDEREGEQARVWYYATSDCEMYPLQNERSMHAPVKNARNVYTHYMTLIGGAQDTCTHITDLADCLSSSTYTYML